MPGTWFGLSPVVPVAWMLRVLPDFHIPDLARAIREQAVKGDDAVRLGFDLASIGGDPAHRGAVVAGDVVQKPVFVGDEQRCASGVASVCLIGGLA